MDFLAIIYKEWLSQPALYYGATYVSDAGARAVKLGLYGSMCGTKADGSAF